MSGYLYKVVLVNFGGVLARTGAFLNDTTILILASTFTAKRLRQKQLTQQDGFASYKKRYSWQRWLWLFCGSYHVHKKQINNPNCLSSKTGMQRICLFHVLLFYRRRILCAALTTYKLPLQPTLLFWNVLANFFTTAVVEAFQCQETSFASNEPPGLSQPWARYWNHKNSCTGTQHHLSIFHELRKYIPHSSHPLPVRTHWPAKHKAFLTCYRNVLDGSRLISMWHHNSPS